MHLYHQTEDQLRRSTERISAKPGRLVQMGRLSSEDVAAALTRVRTAMRLHTPVADADVMIEAGYEELTLKLPIFRDGTPSFACDCAEAHGMHWPSDTQFWRATRRSLCPACLPVQLFGRTASWRTRCLWLY